MNPSREKTVETPSIQTAPRIPQARQIPSSQQDSLEPSRVCPICGSQDWTIFYEVQSVPVTCTSVFTTPAAARSVERGKLELAFCNRCAFVFNRAFSPSLAQIGSRYESSQSASAHFSAYVRSLAAEWVERYGLGGKTVLEIGCGNGDFLRELLRSGVGKTIGMDPIVSRYPIADAINDKLQLIDAAFNESYGNVEADALVCRHTLEHIHDAGHFLRLIAQWAGDDRGRLVLFEVPACERIFAERAFWDIYYEHCNYFTEASLRYTFAQCGLDVQRLVRTYDDQYLVIEARAGEPHLGPPPSVDVAADKKSALFFGGQAYRMIERARCNVRALREEGTVVIWQGAAKTVGFLTALGEAEKFSCAVDMSPHRQDLYLPGMGLKVVSPHKLADCQPHSVVLMNPVYRAEVDTLLRAMVPATRLYTANEICEDNVAP